MWAGFLARCQYPLARTIVPNYTGHKTQGKFAWNKARLRDARLRMNAPRDADQGCCKHVEEMSLGRCAMRMVLMRPHSATYRTVLGGRSLLMALLRQSWYALTARVILAFSVMMLLFVGTAPLLASSAEASTTYLYVNAFGVSYGTCPSSNPCNLSYALSQASSGDILVLLQNVNGPIDLGQYPGISSLTLLGASSGIKIKRPSAQSTIVVPAGKTLNIFGLTVEPALASAGGAIYNSGTLNLRYSTIGEAMSSVSLSVSGSAPLGGGIFNAKGGTATIVGSTIANIVATPTITSNFPNGYAAGVGVYNDGTMTIRRSTIADNKMFTGGALDPLVQGVGVYNEASLALVDSTVADNGVYISSGTTANVKGGGVYNAGLTTMISSTVAGNLAQATATGASVSGGGIYSSSVSTGTFPALAAAASIIADNGTTGTNNCAPLSSSPYPVQSLGFNVTNSGATATLPASECGLTSQNDQPNSNPDLGSLANNGGPAWTMMPGSSGSGNYVIPQQQQVTSPFESAPYTLCPGLDERWYVRPAPGETQCSVGAVEPGSVAPSRPVFTSVDSATFTVGTPGSFPVTASGVPAPTFSLTGTLPSGVSFASDGLLSGTPAPDTASGGGSPKAYYVSITASNGDTPDTVQNFKLVVQPAQPTVALTVTPTATALGSPVVYSASVAGNSGPPTGNVQFFVLEFSYSPTGPLPYEAPLCSATLAPSASLPGTSTASCSSSAAPLGSEDSVAALYSGDSSYAGASVSTSLYVTSRLAITPPATLSCTVGKFCSEVLTASGGTAPYSWSISAGALPAGLSLSPGGTVSGTPDVAFSGTVTVTVKDASTKVPQVASATLELVTGRAIASVSVEAKPAAAVYGSAVTYSAAVTGAGTMPSGTVTFSSGSLSLCVATVSAGTASCTATDTPVGTGQTVTATYSGDSNYLSAVATVQVTVASKLSTSLPAALSCRVGVSCQLTLSATGGTAPYSWKLSSGPLPPGLRFEGGPYRIAGTPSAAGSSTLYLDVADSSAAVPQTSTARLVINVLPAVLPLGSASSTQGSPGTSTLSSATSPSPASASASGESSAGQPSSGQPSGTGPSSASPSSQGSSSGLASPSPQSSAASGSSANGSAQGSFQGSPHAADGVGVPPGHHAGKSGVSLFLFAVVLLLLLLLVLLVASYWFIWGKRRNQT